MLGACKRGLSSSTQDALDLVAVSGSAVTPFQMNQWCIACRRSGEAAIIDAGAPSKKEWEVYVAWAESQNFKIAKVLQTHAHIDHVAGWGFLDDFFPDAEVFLHSDERINLEQAEVFGQQTGFEPDRPIPVDRAYTDLKNIDEVSVGELKFKVLHTPGHAPGHVCFYCEEIEMVFGGDLIFKQGIGRTDLPRSSQESMHDSLRRFVHDVADDATILPGHGPPVLLKDERSSNSLLP